MQILRQKYRGQEFPLLQSVLQQIRGELIYQRQVLQLGGLQRPEQGHHRERDRAQRRQLVLQGLQRDRLRR